MRTGPAVLVAVFLLASAATASAVCAWVLWMKTDIAAGPGSTDWGVVEALPSRADCLAILEKTYTQIKGRTTPGYIRDGSFMVTASDKTIAQLGKCLPDTIDPWGSRGN